MSGLTLSFSEFGEVLAPSPVSLPWEGWGDIGVMCKQNSVSCAVRSSAGTRRSVSGLFLTWRTRVAECPQASCICAPACPSSRFRHRRLTLPAHCPSLRALQVAAVRGPAQAPTGPFPLRCPLPRLWLAPAAPLTLGTVRGPGHHVARPRRVQGVWQMATCPRHLFSASAGVRPCLWPFLVYGHAGRPSLGSLRMHVTRMFTQTHTAVGR